MSKRDVIYLDSNAGAPLQPRVAEALLPFLDSPFSTAGFLANPSSIHSHGRRARRFLSDSRDQIVATFGPGVSPESLIFLSSGTEANQAAIRGVLEPLFGQGKSPHWLTTAVEHDSVLQMVDWVKGRGGSVDLLPVNSQGGLDTQAIPRLWRKETALVSAIWVNNETGVMTDVEALGREVGACGGILHLDAAQAWGKIPIKVAEIPAVSLISVSGHKIGALAGSGALWVRPGVHLSALIRGKQEKGRRGGTENLVGAISMGAAAVGLDPLKWAAQVEPLRNRLQDAICERIPGVCIYGHNAQRVANTLCFSVKGISGESLVMALDLAGFSVSAGAACSSGSLEPSHVLMAMGVSSEEAAAAIRVSLSEFVSLEDLLRFVDELAVIAGRV